MANAPFHFVISGLAVTFGRGFDAALRFAIICDRVSELPPLCNFIYAHKTLFAQMKPLQCSNSDRTGAVAPALSDRDVEGEGERFGWGPKRKKGVVA
jgi:hypothetical protein